MEKGMRAVPPVTVLSGVRVPSLGCAWPNEKVGVRTFGWLEGAIFAGVAGGGAAVRSTSSSESSTWPLLSAVAAVVYFHRLNCHNRTVSSLHDQHCALYASPASRPLSTRARGKVGDWDRALALAPAVSLGFWQQLVARRAQVAAKLSASLQELVPLYLAAGQCGALVRWRTGAGVLLLVLS